MEKETLGIFQDPKGDISSKRVIGFILIGAGVLLCFLAFFLSRWQAFPFASILIGGGVSMFVTATVAEKNFPEMR